MSRSDTACISAWVRRWPRLEGRIALDEVLNRFPDWDVDLPNAHRAPTSTVRGWDSMPAIVR